MFHQNLSRSALVFMVTALATWSITWIASPGLAQDNKADQATHTQTRGETDGSTTAKPGKPSQDETKLVRSIYELTKTTKSAKELTAFITKCDAALAEDLVQANHKYVTSLKGWALNQRGVKRVEIAKQLKSIGNSQHDSIMKQAMKDFDEAITCDAERYRSWMSRGIAHVEAEDFRKAALDFTNVVKLKTELAAGWFNRAESLYHLEQFEAAINDYDVAISLDSDDAQAFTGRGHCQFALGQFTAALKDYETVAKLVPENPMVYINIGDACQQMGKWKDALVNFDKSLSMKHTGVGYQRTAWIKATSPEAEIKNAEEAVQLAKRAIQLTGDSAINLDTLAAAEAAGGNFEVAKTTQAKVISLVSVEEDIAENEVDNVSPYKARLALYEKGEAFIQPAETKNTTEETNQASETDQ